MKHKLFKKLAGIIGYKLVDKNYIKNDKTLNSNSYLNTEKILEFLFQKKNKLFNTNWC